MTDVITTVKTFKNLFGRKEILKTLMTEFEYEKKAVPYNSSQAEQLHLKTVMNRFVFLPSHDRQRGKGDGHSKSYQIDESMSVGWKSRSQPKRLCTVYNIF